MTKLWQMKCAIISNVLDVKERIFIFKFYNEKDRTKVIDGQPWHFDKFIWCLSEPVDEGKLTDTPLIHVLLWARVYDLPMRGRTNEANLRHRGSQLGTFICVDEASLSKVERAVRRRFVNDVRRPFNKVVQVCMPNGNLVEFKVKYERIPTFCYGCKVLGHGEKDYEEGLYDEGDLKFGDELRTLPWKPMKTMEDTSNVKGRSLNEAMERNLNSE
ncbi:uncharacterized protein LOC141651383 [Silene latifolia]|uniref:uncharacterized protein LOC141651383 n=1 Tax=Silene latifolia TaxID=37657 RepID=UPI003D76EE3E